MIENTTKFLFKLHSQNNYQIEIPESVAFDSKYYNNSIYIFSEYFTIIITPTDNTPFAIPGYQFLVLFLSSFAVIGLIIIKKFRK